MELTREGKEIFFIWVPGHVGIRGNSAADFAAKDALGGDISDEFIRFSDSRTRVFGSQNRTISLTINSIRCFQS